MKINKKIAGFDLDGTLTENNQPMKKDMAEILTKLLRKIPVAIITGAAFEKLTFQLGDLLSVIEPETDSVKENLILLPTNGTQSFTYDKNTKKWELSFKEDLVFLDKEDIIAALNEIVASGKYDISKNPVGPIVTDRGMQVSLSGLGHDAPLEAKRNWDPDKKKRFAIKEELEKKITSADFVLGGNSTIDILPKGFNKGVGLTNLLKRKDLSLSDMIYAGDAIFLGGNDYPVKEAGIDTATVKDHHETAKLIESWL